MIPTIEQFNYEELYIDGVHIMRLNSVDFRKFVECFPYNRMPITAPGWRVKDHPKGGAFCDADTEWYSQEAGDVDN